jgi:hypothetical protein
MAAADDLRSPLLSAALREAGLTPGKHLTIVPQTFDAGPLIRGDIDAIKKRVRFGLIVKAKSDPSNRLKRKGSLYGSIYFPSHLGKDAYALTDPA